MLASSDWVGLEGDTQKESSKADLGIYMQRATSTKNGGKSLRQGIRRRRSSSSYEEMLTDPNLEVVVVSLPNSLHFPGTLKALQARKHVLCEKPPTLNAEQMRQLHGEAEQRGLVYFFGGRCAFPVRCKLPGRQSVNGGSVKFTSRKRCGCEQEGLLEELTVGLPIVPGQEGER